MNNTCQFNDCISLIKACRSKVEYSLLYILILLGRDAKSLKTKKNGRWSVKSYTMLPLMVKYSRELLLVAILEGRKMKSPVYLGRFLFHCVIPFARDLN